MQLAGVVSVKSEALLKRGELKRKRDDELKRLGDARKSAIAKIEADHKALVKAAIEQYTRNLGVVNTQEISKRKALGFVK